MEAKDRLIFALDVPNVHTAKWWLKQLDGHVDFFKVGLELFTASREAAHVVADQGRLFLDLKLLDIPTTIGRTARKIAAMGAEFTTVHALGGVNMMRAAVSGCAGKTKVLAVTCLTSMSQGQAVALGASGTQQLTGRLTHDAVEAGVAGVISSPLEAAHIREQTPPGFLIICPGVRPTGTPHDDQARVATPAGAIAAGADYLVVGRPIRNADDPIKAVSDIVSEMAQP